jgi:lambda family phage portal protein
MGAFDRFRARVAGWIAPGAAAGGVPRLSLRSYHAAAGGRLTAGWQGSNSSADAELIGGLQRMRGRSRALVRDASYAKRAKVIVVNNVVGTGIGLQAQVKFPRGRMDRALNDAIETTWSRWTRAVHCHTGGKLHFADLERFAMGQVFEAGEVLIRLHRTAMPGSPVPLALEVIEPERLADHYSIGRAPNGNAVRMGVEVDAFHRPVAYWLHQVHPGDVAVGAGTPDQLVRVPAADMMHLYIVDRWPQSRGEPWLHSAMRRLNDMDGYSEAEIVAARGAASYMAFIKTPDNSPLPPDGQEADQRQVAMEPGIVEQLPPGWDVVMNNPNRPNPNMDPFMRLMLREVAAGVGVSYESLSRDYSQSNYSSSRLALLDDRDLWRILQGWFIRSFRAELHRVWMEAAVLAGAIRGLDLASYIDNRERFEAARFKARGWSWVDPTREVAAYKEAVRCGFTTVADVIAQTAGGADIEDVLEGRRNELDMMDEMDLEFDTDPERQANGLPVPEEAEMPDPAGAETPETPDPEDDTEDDATDTSRIVPLRSHA